MASEPTSGKPSDASSIRDKTLLRSDKTEPIQPSNPPKKESSWSNVFGRALVEAARKDPDIVAITAAMSEGTGLTSFFQEFPDRSFDVGIAEPHAVTFAAGLAIGGKKPVVAIYSTFLQRALDSMIHDVALQNLDVLFAVDRAGLVGADGPTHHGAFDLVYASMIPGFKIFTPATEEEFRTLFAHALTLTGPKLIRYPRGMAKTGDSSLSSEELKRGFRVYGAPIEKAKKVAITIGPVGERIRSFSGEKEFASLSHFAIHQCSPLPESLLKELTRALPGTELYFYEEGIERGSISEGIAARTGGTKHFRCIPNAFISHGSPADLDAKMRWDETSLRLDLIAP